MVSGYAVYIAKLIKVSNLSNKNLAFLGMQTILVSYRTSFSLPFGILVSYLEGH